MLRVLLLFFLLAQCGVAMSTANIITKPLRFFPSHQYNEHTIEHISLSPNGHVLMATFSDTNILKLWDVHTGKELHTLAGHQDYIYDADFSPDGRFIVSASWDRTLKLWSVQTGAELHTLTGHHYRVVDVDFSPDGRFIVSASEDDTVKLWNAHTGSLLRSLTGHTNTVTSVLFSPKGNFVASTDGKHVLRLWDVATGKVLHTFAGGDPDSYLIGIENIAFSLDEHTLFAYGSFEEGYLKAWNVITGVSRYSPTLNNYDVNGFYEEEGLVFSPDKQLIAAQLVLESSLSGTLKLLSTQTGEELLTIFTELASTETLAFSPNGQVIVSSGFDNELGSYVLKLWDVKTGQQLLTIDVGGADRRYGVSMVFSPDGRYLYTNRDIFEDKENIIKVWDTGL